MSDHDQLPARPLGPWTQFTEERTYRHTRLPVELASTLMPDAYTARSSSRSSRSGCSRPAGSPSASPATSTGPARASSSRSPAGRSSSPATATACCAPSTTCAGTARRSCSTPTPATSGRRGRIRCPYHDWTYDTDGTCLGTPLFEGSDVPAGQEAIFDTSVATGFDRADYGLLDVAVDTWGLFVFVSLDPRTPRRWPPSSATCRSASPSTGSTSGSRSRRRTYDVAANYKLVGENFMEYYHLPWVHPELNQVSKFSDHYRWQGPGMYTGMCTTPVSRNTDAGGWDGLAPLSTLGAQDADSGRFVWLFPGTALVVLPNHAFVLFNRPGGAEPHRRDRRAAGPPGVASTPDAEAGSSSSGSSGTWSTARTSRSSSASSEGLENPAYRGGRMCFRFEEPLHRFQNMVIDKMVGIDRVPGGDEDTMTRMFPDLPDAHRR